MRTKGIKINVLGDSITECAYLEKEQSFCSLLSSLASCDVRNYGVGGTCIAPSHVLNKEFPSYDEDFLKRFGLMNHDADVLFVFGGTNDYGHGDAPFGSFFDVTSETFLGSLRILCEKIKKEYKDKLVIFVTPMIREGDIRKKPNVNKGVLSYKLENYANYIKYFASIYGFECIDLYHELNVNPNKIEDKEKYTMDGLHPNALGHEVLANVFFNFLKSYQIEKLDNNWKVYFSKDEVFDENAKHFNVNLPNCMEEILFENKVLGHPYISTNCWDYQKYEDYHQWYVKEFSSDSSSKTITFNGIDTISEIYVNDVLVGTTNNMFLSYSFNLTNLKRKNVLKVHVLPNVVEGKKIKLDDFCFANKYNYESLGLRKSPCSFGWDIFLRAPLGGVYKNVYVTDKKNPFDDLRIVTTLENNVGSVNLTFIEEHNFEKIEINLFNKDFSITKKEKFKSYIRISLNNPLLWNVSGYGEQNLYTLNVKLYKEENVFEKNYRIAFRNVVLDRSSYIQDNGRFEFIINGKKVFLLGTNWVPVDALKHIDKDRMYKALERLIDLGCNAVRVWGGGIYEDDEFYSFCDEHGIFVWQDFMMGCAIYPRNIEFIENIKKEVNFIVSKLSYHPSICLWAGDNECDVACQWAGDKINPNTNIITRKLIPSILKSIDNSRPFMPSSPFEDEDGYKHYNLLAEDHLWGPRDYFRGEYYSKANTYFVSETGYHGCPNVLTLQKFISKTWPLFDKNGNPSKEYLCHATSVVDDYSSPYAFRIRLMADQVNTLFGQDFDNLNDFVIASQISQGEAMKYFIEKMRMYPKGSGIIWWNLLDGWYQISDAIMSYDFEEKLAYQYIKKAQEKVLLCFKEENGKVVLYGSNLFEHDVNISFEIDGETHLITLKKNSVTNLKELELIDHHFYLVKYVVNDKEYLNHYVSNIKGIKFDYYIKNIKGIININRGNK